MLRLASLHRRCCCNKLPCPSAAISCPLAPLPRSTLLTLGVNTFVCLQAEFSLHTPESAWRAGQGLRPYIKDAQRLLIRARETNSQRIKQVRGQGVGAGSRNAQLGWCWTRCSAHHRVPTHHRLPSALAKAGFPPRPSPNPPQDKLDFLHLPILDGNVTSDAAMSRLADDCCARILRGERMYVHW